MKQWNAAKPAMSLGGGCLLLLIAIVLTVLSALPVSAATGYTSQPGVITKVQITTTGCAVTVKYGVWFGVRHQVFTVPDAYMCQVAYAVSVNRMIRVYKNHGRVTSISLPRP